MTILVVDDQENMCWILSRVLSDAGFSVETAGTARAALSIVENGTISALIIDYRLPDTNGLILLSELRKREVLIPAVLITSYGSKYLREQALRLGFCAYFDKPLDNHALIAALQQALTGVDSKGT